MKKIIIIIIIICTILFETLSVKKNTVKACLIQLSNGINCIVFTERKYARKVKKNMFTR